MRITTMLAAALLLTSCTSDVSEDTGEVTGEAGEPRVSSADKGEELSPGDCPEGAEDLLVDALGGGAVEIVHACAYMNCCTDVELDAALGDGVLELTETETGEQCFCEAYFSPAYEVEGLEAGELGFRLGALETSTAVL